MESKATNDLPGPKRRIMEGKVLRTDDVSD